MIDKQCEFHCTRVDRSAPRDCLCAEALGFVDGTAVSFRLPEVTIASGAASNLSCCLWVFLVGCVSTTVRLINLLACALFSLPDPVAHQLFLLSASLILAGSHSNPRMLAI